MARGILVTQGNSRDCTYGKPFNRVFFSHSAHTVVALVILFFFLGRLDLSFLQTGLFFPVFIFSLLSFQNPTSWGLLKWVLAAIFYSYGVNGADDSHHVQEAVSLLHFSTQRSMKSVKKFLDLTLMDRRRTEEGVDAEASSKVRINVL